MRESSVGEDGSSYRSATALTKAAKPAAELANPAAVGKLFSETMRSGKEDKLGREESADSRALRKERNSRKHAWVRAPDTSCGFELIWRVSSVKEDEAAAVVCVRRSA
jgi:hypothetical protein